jgi:AcrR family transcriptional regulator
VPRSSNNSPAHANDDATNFAALSARDAILEAAIAQLDAGGEAAVRLAAIAETADVAIGLISYHFGSRDGLIHAAQQVRYERRLSADIEYFQDLLGRVAVADDLLAGLGELTRGTVASREGAASRLDRVALLGSMHGRPDLVTDLGDLQGRLTDEFAALVERSQDKGLVRNDLDARAVAVFAQAYALGMVLADIDPRRPSDEDLLAVVLAALGAFTT